MFKVLYISYYFPPLGLSGVQRTVKFIKYLPLFNWQVTVITTGKIGYYAFDNTLISEIDEKYVKVIRTDKGGINSLFGKKGQVNIPREWIRKLFSLISKTLFIPDNKKSWSKKCLSIAKDLLEKEDFDLIFVTIPPFSAFSEISKIKKKYNIPLIVDYRDLWLNNQFSFYPSFIHKSLNKKLEDSALRTADKVITINRKIKENLLSTYKFLSFNDIVIIPQGYDREDFSNTEHFNNDKLRLTYSGIFYEFITPKYLLKAFKEITKERPDVAQNFEFHFVGLLRTENKKLIKKLGLEEYIVEYGYLSHPDSIKVLNKSTILWMMIGDVKYAETISTGKLFEYIGSKKPIFGMVPDGAAKSTLTEYEASYICKPNNIPEIKKMLYKIFNDFKSNALPEPNMDFVDKHDRKYLTEKLSNEFQFFIKEVY